MALIGDQLYFIGFRHRDLNLLELASDWFPYNRSIYTGPAYLFLITSNVSDKGLKYINHALEFDPLSADLAVAKLICEIKLNKLTMSTINLARQNAPRSDIVLKLKDFKG